eukprot:scaffold461_cov321-Pavlova_lutheri.AAC.29
MHSSRPSYKHNAIKEIGAFTMQALLYGQPVQSSSRGLQGPFEQVPPCLSTFKGLDGLVAHVDFVRDRQLRSFTSRERRVTAY